MERTGPIVNVFSWVYTCEFAFSASGFLFLWELAPWYLLFQALEHARPWLTCFRKYILWNSRLRCLGYPGGTGGLVSFLAPATTCPENGGVGPQLLCANLIWHDVNISLRSISMVSIVDLDYKMDVGMSMGA